jgi:predicted nucleotidyltransferase
MAAMNHIQEFADRVAERFRPQRILLFGSHASGSAGPDSDVDLLVVMPDGGDPLGTAAEICRQIPASFPVEVIVRDPDDLQRRLAQKDWFLIEIMGTGTVLHAAADD